MRRFVMGDIHGAAKAVEQCLERAGFDFERDELIQLGDIVDGYPDVHGCVEILLRIRHLVAIRGNHDAWFLEFIRTGYHPFFWGHGGHSTAASYVRLTGRESMIRKSGLGYKVALDSSDIPLLHRAFFESQVSYHTDDDYNCFVHGGFDRYKPLNRQRPEIFFWDRILWTDAMTQGRMTDKSRELYPFVNVNGFREIFIGHTPTMNYGFSVPMRAENVLNVDTGARHGGRLTIIDVATKEYWQSDLVSDLYLENRQ